MHKLNPITGFDLHSPVTTVAYLFKINNDLITRWELLVLAAKIVLVQSLTEGRVIIKLRFAVVCQSFT